MARAARAEKMVNAYILNTRVTLQFEKYYGIF